MYMDMDVLAESQPPSRLSSPPPKSINGDPVTPHDGSPVEAEKEAPKKDGNLMKELKQDVQQGAMEFSMDSFF